jgi:hypothetical protein
MLCASRVFKVGSGFRVQGSGFRACSLLVDGSRSEKSEDVGYDDKKMSQKDRLRKGGLGSMHLIEISGFRV